MAAKRAQRTVQLTDKIEDELSRRSEGKYGEASKIIRQATEIYLEVPGGWWAEVESLAETDLVRPSKIVRDALSDYVTARQKAKGPKS